MSLLSDGAQDLLRRWARHLGAVRGRDPKTVQIYVRTVTGYLRFLGDHLGGAPARAGIAAVTVPDLRSWMAARRARGLSASSLAKEVSALRSFYGWLEDAEALSCPAIQGLRAPKTPARLPRPVRETDARAIIDTVSCDRQPWVIARDRAALTLIWGAGLRISEALGLRQCDAPLAEVIRVNGKRGKQREVPILPVSRAAIERYRDLCPHAPGPDDALFLGVRGGPLNPRILSGAMAEARMALGLPATATPHALRHAFATQLLAAGADLRATQELLGHVSPSSTEIYTALDESRLMEVYRSAHPRS
ncbi:MAG: tyrosine recombinase XerC [Pseudomonadota bacterium]